MFTTAIIAFREFLEAFLIIGVFLGISRKLKLRKEGEIALAATLGILVSLLLAGVTYAFGDLAKSILTKRNAEILESYLLTFSGLFLAYVVLSLHGTLRARRGLLIIQAHQKLQKNIFDLSLFLTIVFLVVREGFEIALFTATTSLFSMFRENLMGLLLGFAASLTVGLSTFLAYITFPIGKLFRVTEYAIILLGASLVQNGITQLLQVHLNLHLSGVLSLPMHFLPDEESIFGHVLKNLVGVDREFSLARAAIMAGYVASIYVFFLRGKRALS